MTRCRGGCSASSSCWRARQRGILVKLGGEVRRRRRETGAADRDDVRQQPAGPSLGHLLEAQDRPAGAAGDPAGVRGADAVGEADLVGRADRRASRTASRSTARRDLGGFCPIVACGCLEPDGRGVLAVGGRDQPPGWPAVPRRRVAGDAAGDCRQAQGRAAVRRCGRRRRAPARSSRRIGTATVGAGPGPRPFYLKGPVALTGPYKGAPVRACRWPCARRRAPSTWERSWCARRSTSIPSTRT